MLVAGLRTKFRLVQSDLFSRLKSALLDTNTEEKFDLVCWLVSSKPLRIADDFQRWLQVPASPALLQVIELNNTFIGRYCLVRGCSFSRLPGEKQLEISFENFELLPDSESIEAHLIWGMTDMMADLEVESLLRSLDRTAAPKSSPLLEEETQLLGKRSEAIQDSAPLPDLPTTGSPVKKREIEVPTTIEISDSSSNCKPPRVVESIVISDSGNKTDSKDAIELFNSDCEVVAEPLRSPDKPASLEQPSKATPIIEEPLQEAAHAPQSAGQAPIDSSLLEEPFRITATFIECELSQEAPPAPTQQQDEDPTALAAQPSSHEHIDDCAAVCIELLALPEESIQVIKIIEVFKAINCIDQPATDDQPAAVTTPTPIQTDVIVKDKIDEEPIPEAPPHHEPATDVLVIQQPPLPEPSKSEEPPKPQDTVILETPQPETPSPSREEVRTKSTSPISCVRESPQLLEATLEAAQLREPVVEIIEDSLITPADLTDTTAINTDNNRDIEVSLIPSPTPEPRILSSLNSNMPPNTPIVVESQELQSVSAGSKRDLEVPPVQPDFCTTLLAEEQESNLPQASDTGNPVDPLLPSTSSPKEPTVIVDEQCTATDRRNASPIQTEKDSPKKRTSPELHKELDSNVAVHDSIVNDIEDDRLEITLPESLAPDNEADTPNPSRATAVFQTVIDCFETARLGKHTDAAREDLSDRPPDLDQAFEDAEALDNSATDGKENLSNVPVQNSLTPSLVTNEKLIERFCSDPQIILKHFNIDAQKLHLLQEHKVIKSSSQSVPRSAPVAQEQKHFSKLLREKSPALEKAANTFLNPPAFRKSVQKEPKPVQPTGSIEVEEVIWDQRSDKTFPGNHTPKTNDIFNFLLQRSEKNAFTMGSHAATLGMPETNDPFRISVEAAVKENDLRCMDVEVIRDSPIKKAISEKKREAGHAFRISPASLADRNVALSETNMLQNYARTKSPMMHMQSHYGEHKPFALHKASRKTANPKPIVVESPPVQKVSVGVQVNTYLEEPPQLSDLIRNQTLIQKELATIKSSIARGHYMGESPQKLPPPPAKGLSLEERLIMRDLLDRENCTSHVEKTEQRLQRERENKWMRENKEEVRAILLGLQADYKARASRQTAYYYYSETDSDTDETSSSGLNPSIVEEDSVVEHLDRSSFLKKPEFHPSHN